MIFHQPIRVEFNHCDPAGIVFYPRFLEMTNSVSQGFFREVVGYSYAVMMAKGEGVPSARVEVNYHQPCRLEEVLDWRLEVVKLGTTSLTSRIEAHCGGTHRVTADITQVLVDRTGRPQPWSQAMRDRITAFMEAKDEP